MPLSELSSTVHQEGMRNVVVIQWNWQPSAASIIVRGLITGASSPHDGFKTERELRNYTILGEAST